MLRKVYLTESFICAIESTQCPQFFFPVFLHTKNMTFHFQCTAQLKTGNWEWLWGHLRTLRFAATKLIFQSFLAFSTEAGALNCISLFWWFFGAIHSLDGYPHDKRLLSFFDFNFFCRKRLRMHSQKDCLKWMRNWTSPKQGILHCNKISVVQNSCFKLKKLNQPSWVNAWKDWQQRTQVWILWLLNFKRQLPEFLSWKIH